MKQFAIIDGDMFFQRLKPNERYAKSVSGIQTNLHTYSERLPIRKATLKMGWSA